MAITKPAKLERKNTVAIANPTGHIPERFNCQIKYSLEYLTKEGYATLNYLKQSGRAESFNKAAQNPNVKAIFPIGGNLNTKDILRLIDYESYAQNKPIFVTYSSGSSLLLALHQKSGAINFYGPHMAFLNDKSSYKEQTYTVASFWNMLTAKDHKRGLGSKLKSFAFQGSDKNNLQLKNLYFHKPNLDPEIKFYGYKEETEITGRLLASTLQSILDCFESGYEIGIEGKILLVDSIDTGFEEAYKIIRRLNEISNLKSLNALLVSSLTSRKDRITKDLSELKNPNKRENFIKSLRILLNNNTPVVYGFPCGHSRYKLTIPNGLPAKLKLSTGDIALLSSPTSNP
ncbi:MAG: LD-carboxypeptidase [archaeon]